MVVVDVSFDRHCVCVAV